MDQGRGQMAMPGVLDLVLLSQSPSGEEATKVPGQKGGGWREAVRGHGPPRSGSRRQSAFHVLRQVRRHQPQARLQIGAAMRGTKWQRTSGAGANR